MLTQYHARTFAQALGISKQRISDLVKDGKLHGIHSGRNLIIDVRDPRNLAWLAKRDDLPDELSKKVAALWEEAPYIPDEQETDDEPGDDDTDGGLYTPEKIEELLRKAFAMVAEDVTLTLESNSDWKIPAKIATAARRAKHAGPAIEHALNAFLKRLAADLTDEGARFIAAWRSGDLDFFLEGPDLDATAEGAPA